MSLDLTPRPGAASLPSMVFSHARIEAGLLLRNGEQLLVTLIIPMLVLIVGSRMPPLVGDSDAAVIDVLAPGVLALAIMSSAFTSLAIATGFERRYGLLKRIGATPLPRGGLLAGKILAFGLVQALQLAVLVPTALLLGWSPSGGALGFAWAIVLLAAGSAAFGSLGMLLAGSLRAEATLAIANLVYVLLLVGGAVFIPLAQYPDAIAPFLSALPSTALGEGLRDALLDGTTAWTQLAVLLGWAGVSGVAATRTFSWE